MTTFATNTILRAYRAQHRQEDEMPDHRLSTPTRSDSVASEQDGFEDIIVSRPAVAQQALRQATSPAPPRHTPTPSPLPTADDGTEGASALAKDGTMNENVAAMRVTGSALTTKVIAALRKATQQETMPAEATGAASAVDDLPNHLPHPSAEDIGATPQDMTPSLPHSTRNESHLLTNVSLSEMTTVDEGAVGVFGEVKSAIPRRPRHCALDERAKAYIADDADTQNVPASAMAIGVVADAAAALVTHDGRYPPSPPDVATPAVTSTAFNGSREDDAMAHRPTSIPSVALDVGDDAAARAVCASTYAPQDNQTPVGAVLVAETNLQSTRVKASTPRFAPVGFWQAVISLRVNTNMKRRHDGDPSCGHTRPRRKAGASFLRVLSNCTGIGGQHTAEKRTGGDGSALSHGGVAEDDRGFIDVLKRLPLDRSNTLHQRLLLTIYHLLVHHPTRPWSAWTLRRHDEPPGKGASVAHVEASNEDDVAPTRMYPDVTRWSLIGFQGSDPATDLRSTGLVGLLHVLYMLDYYPGLATRLWDFCSSPPPTDEPPAAGPTSQKESSASTLAQQSGTATATRTLDLPYMLVCFNLSALSMDAMTKGLLARRATRRRPKSGAQDKPTSRRRRSASGTTSKEATQEVYCAPSRADTAHAASFPTLMACSEYFVGCVALFCDMWQKLRQSRSTSSQPSVADFGPVKDTLRRKVLSHKGAKLVFRAVDGLKLS